MLSVRLVGFIVLIMPLSVLAQSGPGGVGTTDGSSSLELWLSADKNVSTSSGDVTNWNDRSGNGVNASAGPSTNEPNFLSASNSSIKGKPTIEFDGSSDYLDLNATVPTGSNGEVTVFIVFKPSSQVTSSTTYQTLLASQSTGSTEGIIALGDYLNSSNSPSSETLTFSKQTTSSPSGHYHDNSISSSFLIHNFDFDGSGSTYYQDNSSASLTSNNGGFSSSSLENLQRIGADGSSTPSNHFSGQIAEIIIYSRQLGTEERNLVANYLDAKYQLGELSSNDYFSNSSNYNNDLIGISGNSPNAEKGGGLELSDLNTGKGNKGIQSGEYLTATHENSTGTELYTGQQNSSGDRWSRSWKIEKTTINKSSNNVRITFNFDDYLGQNNSTDPTSGTNDYELLESSNGSFSNPSDISPGGSGGVQTTSNTVSFDIKYSNLVSSKYYTLATTDNSPLPVEWQYFKGKARAEGNVLKWGTASETNARHFQVQRSGSDKEAFRTIVTIPAAGTTIEPQDYRYTDAVSNRQTHYYRLKQVDYDGSFEYSNVIALGDGPSASAEAELELSRNRVPQGQPIRYRCAHARQQPVTVKLYDARGQQRHSQQLSGDQGARALRADDLSPGVYWLRVAYGQKTISRKVVIY